VSGLGAIAAAATAGVLFFVFILAFLVWPLQALWSCLRADWNDFRDGLANIKSPRP
jgi:hypothetical protein